MKIFTLFSESHKPLFTEFLKSCPINSDGSLDLFAKEVQQHCVSGAFYQPGWSQICYEKVIYFRDICKTYMGETFIYSDVDVQFLCDKVTLVETLTDELGESDIACQEDLGQYCSGFFICKANTNMLNLFNRMLNEYEREDQWTLNKCIGDVDHRFLSNKFYTVGHSIKTAWTGEDFDIPDILVHHANWTVGVERKIKLLEIVRNKFAERSEA